MTPLADTSFADIPVPAPVPVPLVYKYVLSCTPLLIIKQLYPTQPLLLRGGQLGVVGCEENVVPT